MASLRKRMRGGSLMFEIDFRVNGHRKTIPLGAKYTQKTATDLKGIVETLLHHTNNGNSILDKRTSAWIESTSEEIREKLASAGLIAIPHSHTLKELWDSFLEHKTLEQRTGQIKEATVIHYGVTRNHFFTSFKETTLLTDLSKETLIRWKTELLKQFSQATVAGQLKHTKSAFTWAVNQGWIEKSPLDGIGRGSFVNREKDRLVTMAEYHQLLDSCPCQDWRVIIALVRIGGLRCPSEVVRLRWEDVNWEHNKFYVRSPKTARYAGKEGRWVPIFDGLKEELETSFFSSESEGKEFVINRYRQPEQNLRTTFNKILKRAGLLGMPRPFDNMRMTRANEVYNRWGAFKESQWIGHSGRVRMDHYMMLADDDFLNVSEAGNFSATKPKRQPNETEARQNRQEIARVR